MAPAPSAAPDARAALRRQLREARQTWAATEAARSAQAALTARLQDALRQIEPLVLGVYWPMKGEFNPCELARWAQGEFGCTLALPHATKVPVGMKFITWDGETPTGYDEWGIPSPAGKPIEPDVLIVPCLGFTAAGYRMGYGGGYYDRYLGQHPETCALGAAWDAGLLGAAQFTPASHDQPLVAVFTEGHTWGE